MITKVTKAKAEQVLKSVRNAFPMYDHAWNAGPVLVKDYTEQGTWAVCWEEGPYEWAFHYIAMAAGFEAIDEEFATRHKPIKPVKGVWLEPYYSFVLCVYPE